jgi:hypothetical protein
VHPASRNRAADGYPERQRRAALEFRLGGGTAKRGWSPRKGRPLSSFLGESRVAIRPINLRTRSFMPRCGWGHVFLLLRATEETLWLAKSDRSSHGATADSSCGFERLGILRVFRQENCGIEGGLGAVPCANGGPTYPESCANATWDAIWKWSEPQLV